jgi:hypothetical protein
MRSRLARVEDVTIPRHLEHGVDEDGALMKCDAVSHGEGYYPWL